MKGYVEKFSSSIKVRQVFTVLAFTLVTFMVMKANLTGVACGSLFDDSDTGSGTVTGFDAIGEVVKKYVWIFWIAGGIFWAWFHKDEKKSAWGKGIFFGSLVVGIIFILGGSFWQSTYQTMIGWFGN